jgi:DNA-binding MarR family transcriptional regulator
MKAKHLETASALKSMPDVSGPKVSDEYHLNPFMQVIHMFLMVDKFARDPSKIRQFLTLEAGDLQYILSSLERMGLIKRSSKGYDVVQAAFHLKPTSSLFKPHLQLLRLRSLDRIARSTSADSYNLSVTFTASRAVRDQLHEKFMEYLREAEAVIGPAPSDGVYQMNFDLFSWS